MRFSCSSLAVLALLSALCAATPALAQKALHDGFQVELLYQAPEIEHPSVVACDDDGNLFIGEDPMDMRGPTTKHIDRIIYVRFDKQTGKTTKTVFAENLSAVFGMIWRDGALYVMHAPLYSVLRDTNGDGVADERKDLVRGFGPDAGVYGFNDHIVTGTRLGIDNRVYISVGDKGIPLATGADGSTVTLEGGGVVRMQLDGTQLENFTSGTRNHLDVALDPLDNIFTYDNTDDGLGWWTRFTHHVPTGYYGYPYDYHPHPERHLPRISEHQGGSPVGAACYNEAAWPERYRGAAFHCEWGKGTVQVFFPKQSGATFEATMEDFLVKGDDQEEFRPLDLCFSPDGKYMYLADWNFGGWVNPKVCGRVFRISYLGPDVPAEPQRASHSEDVAAQLQALAHPAHSERLRAQHKLAQLGDRGVEPLAKLLRDPNSSKWARIHAIWTQNEMLDRKQVFAPEAEWARLAVEDQDPAVRAQAARALGLRRARVGVDRLLAALSDSDAAVRMHAAIALGRIGDAKAAPALFGSLDDNDAFARHTRVQALRAIGDWKSARKYLEHTKQEIRLGAILALTGQYQADAVAELAWAATSGVDDATRAAALAALTEVHHKADPYTTGWWGTQPAKGKPARSKMQAWAGTETVMQTLRAALQSDQDAMRAVAVKALGEMKDPATVPIAVQMAGDAKLAATVRADALQLLVANSAAETGAAVARLLEDVNTPELLVLTALDVAEQQKLTASAPSVRRRLESASAPVQAAALSSLTALQGEAALPELLAALKSAAPALRRAGVVVVGKYGVRGAIPALLAAASDPQFEQETLSALAAMPDRRALGLYLQGVTSKNSTLRDASRLALIAIKSQIGDEIIERHRRNELSPEMRRELQGVFAAPTVVREWQIVGAWPQTGGEPKFDAGLPPDLNAPLMIGAQSAMWKSVKASAEGKVGPGQHVKPHDGVWSLAYAAVESPLEHTAEFLLGSDDQAVLWINGERLFQFTGNRGWTAAQDRGQVKLKQGLNHVYFLCGNTSGPWDFSLALRMHNPDYAFLFEDVPAALDVAVYREHALKTPGDAARGQQIFADTKGVGCIKCHAVAGQGAKIGPDMLGIGAKYPREELVRSVLEPSARVAESYLITNLVTEAGQVLSGIVQSETETELELIDAAGKLTKIKKNQIEDRQKTSVSLMPNGLKDGMSLADFADVIAYLESLKQEN